MKVFRSIARPGVAALFAGLVAIAGPSASWAEEATATQAVEPLPVETVVATVDGKPLTAGEMRVALQFLPQQYYYLPGDFLFNTLLREMIDIRLMAEAASAEGIDQAEVERQVVFYRERLLHQAYLKKRKDVEITPEVIKQRYEEMLKAAVPEDEVRAHHILVKTEEEVKAIAEELAKGGNFEALAQAKSIDQSNAKDGGDLGYFKKSKMVPEFADVAFATEKGKVSAPVQTEHGWHLIRVDDRRAAQPPTFEEVVPDVRDQLMAELVDRAAKAVRAEKKIEMVKLDAYAVLGLPKPVAPPTAESLPATESKDGAAPSDAPAATDTPAAAGSEKKAE